MNNTKKKTYFDGYPALAAFIASDKDRSTFIYKRFDRLAARNLLVLQSELAAQQLKLDAFDKEDWERYQSGGPQSLAALRNLQDWDDYKATYGPESDRLKLMMAIRKTLKEFREALILESTLASIPPPDRNVFKAFKSTFFRGLSHHSLPLLEGHGARVYDDLNDLVALYNLKPPDRLTVFVKNRLGFLFKDKEMSDSHPNTTVGYASSHQMEAFISFMSTVLATLLLVGAILVLYKVTSNDLKLGLIALFTITFAGSVGLLTNASMAEVFGATAAYAAVLVVFVSGNIGGG